MDGQQGTRIHRGAGEPDLEFHRRGESLGEIERILGATMPRIRRFLRESGGIRPVPRARRIGHITAGEREEVSRGIAAGDSARTIAENACEGA